VSHFFRPALTRPEIFLLLGTLILQLLVAAIPDPFPGGSIQTDIDDYRNWCRVLVLQGLEAAYWGDVIPLIDYPPLIPYLYFSWGWLIHSLSPEVFLSNNALNFLIKIPALICNVLISYLLLLECKSRNIALNKTALLALFVNLPLIFDTSYWGQTDSVVCLLLLSSLLMLQKQKLIACYVLFTLACFSKPLAWPFSILILLVSLKKYSPHKILCATAAALVTALWVLLPFAFDGNFVRIINDLFFHQLDTMPYISVNAHNLWWVVATQASMWTDSSSLVLGLISYKLMATLLFLILYAAILFKSSKTILRPDFDLLKTAALVALAFFMLSPHMHENHLYNFFPLAFIFMMGKPGQPQYSSWYITLMFCSLFNMAIHDPYVGRVAGWYLRDILMLGFNLDLDTSRIFEHAFIELALKLGALIAVMIFIQLLWQEFMERPLSMAWQKGLWGGLGLIAVIRIVV